MLDQGVRDISSSTHRGEVSPAVTDRVLKESNICGDKNSRILDFSSGWRGYDICMP